MTQIIDFHKKKAEKRGVDQQSMDDEAKKAICLVSAMTGIPEDQFEFKEVEVRDGIVHGIIKKKDNYNDPIDYLDR
jgi:hypothetical protein